MFLTSLSNVATVFSSVDTIWVLIAAVLVFFMQAGFAMVESGFTRAKNAGNIIMKNLMDFSLGSLLFWFLGFGIMFGAGGRFFGGFDFFAGGDYSTSLGLTVPTFAFLIFQTVFCATAATIVSGAMAERTKFISYCFYTIALTLIVYPISGYWIWGDGWLADLGFHDFAGSTVVHMVGGVAAFVGAIFLGPRIGKYDKDKKSKAIPGHSLTLGALGVFILWMGWFGFNPGSELGATGDAQLLSLGNIFITTNLAAAAAAVTTMIVTWIRYKKPDVSMTLNGALGGLVAITAGTDVVTPAGSVIIGFFAGIVIVFGIELIDKVFKVDDPVGAVGVHGLNGAMGTIMVGAFSTDGGFLYGNGFSLLGVQVIGVLAVGVWVAATMSLVFFVIKKTIGLRVSAAEEIAGLDIEEHGLVSSYADFMPSLPASPATETFSGASSEAKNGVDIDEAVPVELKSSPKKTGSDVKLTKVEIIMNPSKFEPLKSAMNSIGVTGMTVTNVMGCGIQKGHKEYYRGIELEVNLLPKVSVEIVICKVPLEKVIETAKGALYTGNIGDGKIFVYDVENVVKVRTGEEGYAALQDD